MGGEVRFETKLTGIRSRNGSVYALEVESGGSVETIETDNVILAIGHSARDTFKLLYDGGFAILTRLSLESFTITKDLALRTIS